MEIMTTSSLNSPRISRRSDIDTLHGPHQVAMKSRRTTLPSKSLSLKGWPSMSTREKSLAPSFGWSMYQPPATASSRARAMSPLRDLRLSMGSSPSRPISPPRSQAGLPSWRWSAILHTSLSRTGGYIPILLSVIGHLCASP